MRFTAAAVLQFTAWVVCVRVRALFWNGMARQNHKLQIAHQVENRIRLKPVEFGYLLAYSLCVCERTHSIIAAR